ncbi:MAG: TldD/PmbA family protein [Nitratireductor sp.]
MINLKELENNATKLMSATMKAGADACDVVVAHGQSQAVTIRDGKVENTDRSEGDQFSLRVFVGSKVASVASNQITDYEMLAERAVAMAKVSPEDPFQALAEPEQLASEFPDIELLDETVPTAESLTKRALETESAGLGVKGVAKSMGASAGWGTSGFVLAASNGFSGSYSRSGFSSSTAMLCGSGEKMERDYDFTSAVFEEDLRSSEDVGKTAGQRAVRKINPRQVESGNFPLIFDKRISSGMLGALLSAINGSSVVRKTSFLRDQMNEQVMHKGITIQDNPRIQRGAGSRLFDGEGLSCDALTLVENGILNTWLLDGASARELGLAMNGRGSRGGSGTSPTSTNSYIEAGEQSLEEMLAQIGTGLYVTETIGHGINMVTGDYSKGAGGYWVENGELAFPVAEITIAGNLKQMFMNMYPANDLEFTGATNAPSLLIEGMTIGGK